jgi:predicted permease
MEDGMLRLIRRFACLIRWRRYERDVGVGAALTAVWRDVVYGLRVIRREPTFAATALLTLTLGSATTITAFSIANAELWRPLPFPDAHRLVAVESQRPGTPYGMISGPDFLEWTRQCRLAAYAGERLASRRVLETGGPQTVRVAPVTTNFFAVLGRAPSLGRGFTAADARARTLVVSDAAWRRLFDADPAVLGRPVRIDGESFTIIGVNADARLEFEPDPDFFVAIDPDSPAMQDRAARTLQVYGRTAPGVSLGQAEAELRTVAAGIAAAYPATARNGEVLLLSDLQAQLTGFNWRELYFFLGGAALVMVLACLNVASLLLARALRRQREFAIRGALGGGSGALVRQLLVEGAVLALPSMVAASFCAAWLLRGFTALVPADLLERGGHITLDSRVAAFAGLLTLAITTALALSPLVFARRIDLNVMLGHGARTAGRSPRQRATRTGLLVAQVSATLVLLAAAGLFVISYLRLTSAPLGFEPQDRVIMRLSLPDARYANDQARADFAERWLSAARAVAGVREVAIGDDTPLSPRGLPATRLAIPGRPRPERGSEPIALFFSVSPRYFAALGIALLDGRAFADTDTAGAARVAIVSEKFAQYFFPGERAVGRTVELIPRFADWTSRPGLVTIVGVAANVRNFSVDEAEYRDVYVPFAQAPAPALDLVAATSIPAAHVAEPLRRAARRLDPGLPIASLTLGTERVSESFRGARFNLWLVAVFAGLAVLIAGVGIYGSMACAVEERTREFGVRIALGATRRAILAEALRGSILVAIVGCALGTALVFLLARAMGDALYLVPNKHGGMLYRVGMTDPVALGAACALLLGAALGAALVPARRATRTDPLVALRLE